MINKLKNKEKKMITSISFDSKKIQKSKLEWANDVAINADLTQIRAML